MTDILLDVKNEIVIQIIHNPFVHKLFSWRDIFWSIVTQIIISY